MGFNPSLSGKYFKDRLIGTEKLLALVNLRFDLEDDENLDPVYYWILDIERAAKLVGKQYYSRRGRKTLIGLLETDRIWLRSKIYHSSKLTKNDFIDSNNHIKPIKDGKREIDFEKLISDISRETKVIQKLLLTYSEREAKLIKKLKEQIKQKLDK